MTVLFTVGHGTSSQAGFTGLLASAGVASLVDVRIAPGSRKHPHFGKDSLASWLPAAGITYRWEQQRDRVVALPPPPDRGPLRPAGRH